MEPAEYRPIQNEDVEALGTILGDTWHACADGRKRVVCGVIDLANFALRNTATATRIPNWCCSPYPARPEGWESGARLWTTPSAIWRPKGHRGHSFSRTPIARGSITNTGG